MLPLHTEVPTAAETKFARDVVKLASIVKLERKNNVSLSALTNLCLQNLSLQVLLRYRRRLCGFELSSVLLFCLID